MVSPLYKMLSPESRSSSQELTVEFTFLVFIIRIILIFIAVALGCLCVVVSLGLLKDVVIATIGKAGLSGQRLL